MWNLVVGLVSNLVVWFLEQNVRKYAVAAGFTAFALGLFAAFVAATLAALYAVQVAAPPAFSFAFSFVPSSATIYIGVYLTALVSKRVFDFKYETLKTMAGLNAYQSGYVWSKK